MGQDKRKAAPLLKWAEGLVSAISSILRALARSKSRIPGRISVNRVAGNFLMGDFFGDVKCRYGHPVRGFNIGRGHFVACDGCRTHVLVGSNLMGNWRQEDEDIWRQNSESVAGYEFIEWADNGWLSLRCRKTLRRRRRGQHGLLL